MHAETWHWLAITQDGRHFVLDPNAIPSDGALREFVSRLEQRAMPGWLATSQQVVDGDEPVELDLICKLTTCSGDWATAVRAFQRLRTSREPGAS